MILDKMAAVQKNRESKLAEMATVFQGCIVTIENSYMIAAQILYDAKEMYDETEEVKFIEWAMEMSGFQRSQVFNYIKVYERFGEVHYNGLLPKKPIPFNTLLELSKPKIPKATVNKVLRKFNNNKLPQNRPTVKEVKAIIREDVPQLQAPKKMSMSRLNTFKERVRPKGNYVAGPERLLNMAHENTAETVRIVARYWKQKYHPDKPEGDAEIFNRIVKAEKQLLEERR